MGVLDMALYRVRKLLAWVLAFVILALLVAGVWAVVTMLAGGGL